MAELWFDDLVAAEAAFASAAGQTARGVESLQGHTPAHQTAARVLHSPATEAVVGTMLHGEDPVLGVCMR